ncbi:uncharacterized protein LOC116167875 [Photinus pyralis]|nr:uncharacterized protein LOC116167875 [Photinus pyralis]
MENCGGKKFEEFLECAIPPGDRLVRYSLNPCANCGPEIGLVTANAEIITQRINGKETLATVSVMVKACTKCDNFRQLFPNVLEVEISFYKYILPALKQFVVDQGGCKVLDFFPKFHGVFSSSQSDAYDEDAILLIENVEEPGQQVTYLQCPGYNFETTNNILRDLAIFHAVPIAFKSVNADKFIGQVIPHLQYRRTYQDMSEKLESELLDIAIKAARLSAEGEELLPRVVKAIGDNLLNFSTKDLQMESEQFLTIIHNNLYLDNVVAKFENDIHVENKFVGLNMLEYGSLARDLVFVLLMSVNMEVLKESYWEFIRGYYNTFISVLMELNCDTHQYTLELLQEEIRRMGGTMEFLHVMLTTSQLYGQQKDAQPIEDDTEVDLLSEVEQYERCLQRMHEIILFFGRASWI